MPERTVKILGFRYTDEEGNDLMARQGRTLDFSEEDAARGDANGAFVVEEAEIETGSTIGPESTDEELEAFAKDAKVKEVVSAAGNDGDFAQRLLAAENAATGNDARPGVAKGLAAIVGTA